jgi:hypothetical protein
MFQQPFDLIKIDQCGRPLWLCATKTREEAQKKAQVERTLDPNYEFRLLNTLTGRIEVFVVAELVD